MGLVSISSSPFCGLFPSIPLRAGLRFPISGSLIRREISASSPCATSSAVRLYPKGLVLSPPVSLILFFRWTAHINQMLALRATLKVYSRERYYLLSFTPSSPAFHLQAERNGLSRIRAGGLLCSPPGPHCRALGLDVVSLAGLGVPGRGQAWVLGQREGASLCWQARCPAGRAGSRGTSHPAHQRLPSAAPVERPLGGRTAPAGTQLCCRTVPGPAGPGG